MDSLAPQAFGAGELHLVGLYTQRGLVVVFVTCLPVALLWFFSGAVLGVFVEESLASPAGSFIRARIISLPAIGAFEILRRYSSSQLLAWPVSVACFAGGAAHVVCCYFLILRFGLIGASYSISIGAWVTLLALIGVLLLMRRRLAGSMPVPRLGDILNRAGMLQFIRFGLPAAASLLIEWGGYEVFAVFAAWLGDEALAVSSIISQLTYFWYLLPYGLSGAAAVLFGEAVGAGKVPLAKATVILCYLLLTAWSLFNSAIGFAYIGVWGKMFSDDPVVVSGVSQLYVVMFFYGIFDHWKCLGIMLLRSAGRPSVTVVIVFLAMLTSYPFAWLASKHIGVTGIWLGLTICWMIVGGTFVVLLFLTDFDQLVASTRAEIDMGSKSQDGSLSSVDLPIMLDQDGQEEEKSQ